MGYSRTQKQHDVIVLPLLIFSRDEEDIGVRTTIAEVSPLRLPLHDEDPKISDKLVR